MTRRPNVVFIMSDQHRWDFMGYESSNGVTFTPNLDALGSAGRIFRRAYCPAPLCSPSRAALALGRYGMNSGCFTNLHQPPAGSPTFMNQFRQAGYRTACVGKTHMKIHHYQTDLMSSEHVEYMRSLGWDDNSHETIGGQMICFGLECSWSRFLKAKGVFREVARFYDHWGYFMNKEKKPLHSFEIQEYPFDPQYKECSYIGSSGVDWLKARDRSQPFLLHVGFCGPHSPIEPLGRFMDLYRSRPEPTPVDWPDMPEKFLTGRRGYRAMISEIDEWVGKMRGVIADQGELDNTIFVFTSDHGEMCGDFKMFDKTCFYEGAARVPLVIAGPGVDKAPASDALVETLDLGRTLCELCGLEPHTLDQGKSLLPVLTGQSQTHRDSVYIEMGCDRMIFDGRYKLMWGDPRSDTRELGRLHLNKPVTVPHSPTKLYDLHDDPQERHDLAADPSRRELLRMMMEKLLDRINANTQTQPFLSRGEFRPYKE